MKLKLSILSTLILLTLSLKSIAGKLPDDILDVNVAFALIEEHSLDNVDNVKLMCETKLLDAGFNLVISDNVTNKYTQKEFEFDYKNKEVKYLILCRFYRTNSGIETYMFYLLDNENELSFDRPKSYLAVTYSYYDIDKAIKKFEDKVDKFKKKNPSKNKVSYDETLILKRILTAEQEILLAEERKKNTIIDRAVEYDLMISPNDLKNEKLAIILVQAEDTDGVNYINKKLKSKMKKYPYNFMIFDTFEDFETAGGDEVFKYRIYLVKKRHTILTEKNNQSVSGNYRAGSTAWNKDLYSIAIKNLQTNELHQVAKSNFIGQSMEGFINELNH